MPGLNYLAHFALAGPEAVPMVDGFLGAYIEGAPRKSIQL